MVDLFEKEVKDSEYWSEDIKEELLKMRKGNRDGSLPMDELSRMAAKLLKVMFETPYYNLIPAEFLDTHVGTFLIKLKYVEQTDTTLSTAAVALISGKSRNMINKEIRACKLPSTFVLGKHQVRETDLIDYVLRDKKNSLSEEEILEMIELYKRLKNNGMSEKEIEKVWRDR